MPFSPSGVFERLYSWVTDRDNGVKILAQRMDDETNGIVQAINQLTSGAVAFRGPVKTVNGTKGTPAFAFKDDPNTGIYRVGEDVLGLTGGTADLQIGPTTFTYSGNKVYHAGDKPTPADVGALPAGGKAVDADKLDGLDSAAFAQVGAANTFTGSNTFSVSNTFGARQDIATTSESKLRMSGSGIAVVEAFSATAGQRTGSLAFDNLGHVFRAYLDAAGGQPAARMELNRDGTLKVNGSTVYHTGNKPTAAEVIPDVATAVGSVVLMRSTGAISLGTNYTGSTLTVAGFGPDGAVHVGATTGTGTWRAHGACPAGGVTLFMRMM